MPGPSQSFIVEIEGSPLPDALSELMVSGYVDDSLKVPDMFVLVFSDPNRTVLSENNLQIGKKVTIKVVTEDTPSGEVLLKDAEITALETDYHQAAGSLAVVRGLDQSHRLFRGRVTKAYPNSSYSDVATQIAQRNSLATGTIDSTGVVLDMVSQINVSDWEFLAKMAQEVGYELIVSAGKLDFCKQTPASGAPGGGDLNSTNPLQLVLGDSLLRFRCSITSAEQVSQVKVQSWDPTSKQPLEASAPATSSGVAVGVTPAQLASKFGSPTHTATNIPLAKQPELDAAAKAIAEEIGGVLATVDGVARGNVKLRAGALVNISQVGDPFNGKYKLTTTRHSFDQHEGYTTSFTVSGRKDSTLLYLASSSNSGAGKPIPGVVQAIVTNAKDPEDQGRVKVKFPWLSADYETDWVRTVQLWAGNGYGAVVVPEVNDEVIVAFEQGDIRRPYLLGGVYNGQDKPKAGTTDTIDSGGKVARRDFFSRTGHRLSFTEDPTKSDGVLLETGDEKLVLHLDKKSTKITLSMDSGDIQILSTGSPGTITVKADQDLTLQGNKITIKANAGISMDAGGGNVDIKGVQFNAQGSAGASVKGATVSINGDAQAELKGGAMVSVQGAIVKIN